MADKTLYKNVLLNHEAMISFLNNKNPIPNLPSIEDCIPISSALITADLMSLHPVEIMIKSEFSMMFNIVSLAAAIRFFSTFFFSVGISLFSSVVLPFLAASI